MHVHIHSHVYACNTLPGEGAAPSEAGRGLGARPHQACVSVPHADTIKSTQSVACPCFRCQAGSLANAEPQSHFHHPQLSTHPPMLALSLFLPPPFLSK